MYLKHFNLSERPFSITPDPRFLYMSARHKEALAHLLYGLGEGGGFVQLTGEVGTGKTTICRCLLEQVPDNVDIALVLNPKVTAIELIATVCDELGIVYPAEHSIKNLTDLLNARLLDAHQQGRRTVLIIDEAQNLEIDVLEQVRLLTNLETAKQKLLQIVLIGQPELRSLLASDQMRQLSQRITARYHLEPITREESEAYIKHRLQICGISRIIFPRRTIDRIQKLSGGIPRLINVLCDRAMLGAYVEGKTQVDMKVLNKAAAEVISESRPSDRDRQMPWKLGTITAVLAVAALFGYQYLQMDSSPEAAPVGAPLARTAPATPKVVPARPAAPVRPAAPALAAAPAAVTSTAVAAAPVVAAPAITAPVTPQVTKTASTASVARSKNTSPSSFVVRGQENAVGPLGNLLLMSNDEYVRASWVELLTLWSVESPETVGSDYCGFAYRFGLQCLDGQGNWDVLRTLDRPVILKLVSAGNRRVPVVLQHLQDRSADLIIGAELYRMDIAEVGRFWKGEYTLLLQTPPGGALFLRAGSRSADVQWLRKQLEQVLGVGIPATDPLLFDQVLKRNLMEFQRNRGLVPDGIMGKNTIIHLNSYASPADIPRLARRAS